MSQKSNMWFDSLAFVDKSFLDISQVLGVVQALS